MIRSLLLTAALSPLFVQSAAAEQGDWLVRLRGIVVAPTETTSDVLPGFPAGRLAWRTRLFPKLILHIS